MGILADIMGKIFHHTTKPQAGGPAASPAGPVAAASPQAPATQAAAQPAAQQPAAQVDVDAVLTEMASAKGGGGNYRTSIVDLLKLLDLDSSLDSRKQLANELNVHVGADGSAEENIALHRAVMQKLEENGGKVPADMKS